MRASISSAGFHLGRLLSRGCDPVLAALGNASRGHCHSRGRHGPALLVSWVSAFPTGPGAPTTLNVRSRYLHGRCNIVPAHIGMDPTFSATMEGKAWRWHQFLDHLSNFQSRPNRSFLDMISTTDTQNTAGGTAIYQHNSTCHPPCSSAHSIEQRTQRTQRTR